MVLYHHRRILWSTDNTRCHSLPRKFLWKSNSRLELINSTSGFRHFILFHKSFCSYLATFSILWVWVLHDRLATVHHRILYLDCYQKKSCTASALTSLIYYQKLILGMMKLQQDIIERLTFGGWRLKRHATKVTTGHDHGQMLAPN